MDNWISVKDALPAPETKVLVLWRDDSNCGITTGMYENGKITTEDSNWFWDDCCEVLEYDEEKDLYIIPEGWWECKDFNYENDYDNVIDCPVLFWSPLPDLKILEANLRKWREMSGADNV